MPKMLKRLAQCWLNISAFFPFEIFPIISSNYLILGTTHWLYILKIRYRGWWDLMINEEEKEWRRRTLTWNLMQGIGISLTVAGIVSWGNFTINNYAPSDLGFFSLILFAIGIEFLIVGAYTLAKNTTKTESKV
jgi:hypothetical protein